MEKYKRVKGALLSPEGMAWPRQLCLQHPAAARPKKKAGCEEKQNKNKGGNETSFFPHIYDFII